MRHPCRPHPPTLRRRRVQRRMIRRYRSWRGMKKYARISPNRNRFDKCDGEDETRMMIPSARSPFLDADISGQSRLLLLLLRLLGLDLGSRIGNLSSLPIFSFLSLRTHVVVSDWMKAVLCRRNRRPLCWRRSAQVRLSVAPAPSPSGWSR